MTRDKSNTDLNSDESALDEMLRSEVIAALDDPRPSRSADEVFDRLRRHHAERSAPDYTRNS